MSRGISQPVRIHPRLEQMIRQQAEKKQVGFAAASLDIAELAACGRAKKGKVIRKAGLIDFDLLDKIEL